MSKQIQAVILGAGGYVGGELLRLLAGHANFELAAAVSDSRAGQPIADTFPHLSQVLTGASFVASDEWLTAIGDGGDVALFSAAPHAASAGIIKAALSAAKDKNLNMHVVDSSADFRYSEQSAWETRNYCRNSAVRSPSISTRSIRRTLVIRAASRQRPYWQPCPSCDQG